MDYCPSFNRWCDYYSGELNGLNVIIQSEIEAITLHSAGAFGIRIQKQQHIGEEDPVNLQLKDGSPCLALTLEEAFFLSYALGRLFIACNGRNLDLEAQWELFCKSKASFPCSYAAYHHFRAKGWVPKEGLKYGVDYVLYKQRPSSHHAEYAVVVVPGSSGKVSSESFFFPVQMTLLTISTRKVTWSWMAGLGRLALSVSKTLLYCNIVLSENASSLGCLKRANISTIEFSRWASAKEQEDERDIDVMF